MADRKNFASSDVTKRKNSEPAKFFKKKVVEEIVEELLKSEGAKDFASSNAKKDSEPAKSFETKDKKKLEEPIKKNNSDKKLDNNVKSKAKEKNDKKEEENSSKDVEDEIEEKEIVLEEISEPNPKGVIRAGLETEIVTREIPRVEEERREVDFSNDYNLRLQRNQFRGDRTTDTDGGIDESKKQTRIYDSNNKGEVDKNFYDTGGREPKKDIYSSEKIGDKASGQKFIHGFSDLEKKSEETTMGNFGIVEKKRKGDGDNHYDEMGR